MKLSIIIPAYNEERRMLPTLNEYYNFYNKKLKQDFEIIIISNNCKDRTFEVAKDFSKGKNQVKVFNIPGYSGKGGAVMKGFELAKGDYIGFIDADNSTNIENFHKLFEMRHNFDGIIASRKINGAIIYPPRRLNQEFSSFLFNRVVRILLNIKFYDTQCGAKLFRKDVAKFLSENYTEIGWIFDVDLLYLCKKKNFKILEYPIFWKDCYGSHLTFVDGINSVLKLFRYRLKISNKNGS